jgi:hypothetical protein
VGPNFNFEQWSYGDNNYYIVLVKQHLQSYFEPSVCSKHQDSGFIMFTLDKKKLVNEKHEFGYCSQASGMDNLCHGCFAGDFLFCLSDNRL